MKSRSEATCRSILSALLFLTAIVVGACGERDASAAIGDGARSVSDSLPSRPLDVTAALARRGDLVLRLAATGVIRAEATSTLRSEVAATVVQVPASDGRRVRRGEAVVVFDRRPFELALREAESALAQARVVYDDQVLPDSLLTGHPASAERKASAYARSGLQAAEARVESARLDLERAVIRAPFDGVVQHVAVAVGDRATAGQELLTLVDLDHLRVEAAVLEHDLAGVQVGSPARVTTPAAPGRVRTGRVTAILPVVDSATRAARVLVALPGDGLLRPGMSADVELATSTLRQRLLVPAAAVIERDGRPLVFVVHGGRAQWTYVQPGSSNGRETEIAPDSAAAVPPVAPGDTVLVGGHLTLTHDAPVKAEVPARPRE